MFYKLVLGIFLSLGAQGSELLSVDELNVSPKETVQIISEKTMLDSTHQISCEHFHRNLREEKIRLEAVRDNIDIILSSYKDTKAVDFLSYLDETRNNSLVKVAKKNLAKVYVSLDQLKFLGKKHSSGVFALSASSYEFVEAYDFKSMGIRVVDDFLEINVNTFDICEKQSFDLFHLVDCETNSFEFSNCENDSFCKIEEVGDFRSCRLERAVKVDLSSLQSLLGKRDNVIRKRN